VLQTGLFDLVLAGYSLDKIALRNYSFSWICADTYHSACNY